MSFSRILYMICANGGYLVSEILVVCTHLCQTDFRRCRSRSSSQPPGPVGAPHGVSPTRRENVYGECDLLTAHYSALFSPQHPKVFAVQETQLSALQQCFWVVDLVPGVGRILPIPAHSPTPDVVIFGLVGRWLGPLCIVQITYIVYANTLHHWPLIVLLL